MQTTRVKFIKPVGKQKCIDLEIDSEEHNFIADGLVVSNSHSVSYATLATWTLYLKFNHPKEFFLSLLRMSKHEPKPHQEISKIFKELHYFGIKLLPPDLVKSGLDFTIEGNDIRYGLSSIKGVSNKTLESLVNFKQDNPDKFDMYIAAKQAGINIGVLSSLIQAGALSSFSGSRSFRALEAQVFNKLNDTHKEYVVRLAHEYDGDIFKTMKGFVSSQRKKDSGKTPIMTEKQFEKIKADCEKYVKIFQQNSKNEDLANWYYETKLLGFSYSSSVYTSLRKKDGYQNIAPLDSFDSLSNNDKIMFAGIAVDVHNTKSKQNKRMLKVIVEDGNKSVLAILFGDSYEKWAQDKANEKGELPIPEKESLVVCIGKKSNDIIFLDNIYSLDDKIYLKSSQIKE